MAARDTIAAIRTLHAAWAKTGLVVAVAFPWAGGEVVEFAADRAGAVLGIRDFYVLADLPTGQRAGFLALLRGGAVVESLSPELPPVPVVPPKPKSKRRASS